MAFFGSRHARHLARVGALSVGAGGNAVIALLGARVRGVATSEGDLRNGALTVSGWEGQLGVLHLFPQTAAVSLTEGARFELTTAQAHLCRVLSLAANALLGCVGVELSRIRAAQLGAAGRRDRTATER